MKLFNSDNMYWMIWREKQKIMSDTNGFGHNRVHSSEIEDTIVAQNNGREQFEDDDLDEEGSVVSSIVDR